MLIRLLLIMDMLMAHSVTMVPGTVMPGAIHAITGTNMETGVATKTVTSTGNTTETMAEEKKGRP